VRSLVVVATLVLGSDGGRGPACRSVCAGAAEAARTAAPRDVEIDTAVAAGLLDRARGALVAERGDDATARVLLPPRRWPGSRPPPTRRGGPAHSSPRSTRASPPVAADACASRPSRRRPTSSYDRDLEPACPMTPDAPRRPLRPATRHARRARSTACWPAQAIGVALAGADSQRTGRRSPASASAASPAGSSAYAARKRSATDRVAAPTSIGSGVLWGGVAGALFADVVSGLDRLRPPTTSRSAPRSAAGSAGR
jgi:hypothetical protein